MPQPPRGARRALASMLAALLLAACAAAPPWTTPNHSTRPSVSASPSPASATPKVFDHWPVTDPVRGGADGALPPGFSDELVFNGLIRPTAVRFAPDGRAFVAEQRGVVLAFPALEPRVEGQVVADLRTEVFNHFQLGLLGLAVDPDFSAQPYLYLGYTRDAPLGGSTPTYGVPATDEDDCARSDPWSCIVSARLARVRLTAEGRAGQLEVLIDDWCQSSRNHSLGGIVFDSHGALIIGGGDGANGALADYGHRSSPPNACGDPPTQVGDAPDAGTSEAGALRSQDITTRSDPLALHGTVLRVDRRTGAGLSDNPLAGDADVNARRVIAHGLRNPFRMALRPGTAEVWLADVGWDMFDELNVLDVPPAAVLNFGWPCFEGPFAQPAYQAAGHALCERLYASAGAVSAPRASFAHRAGADTSEASCGAAHGSALSSVAFYEGDAFPAPYRGALFLADPARRCLWVMPAGESGGPSPESLRLFATGASVVDMQSGPDGALYYVDIAGGSVRRVSYRSAQR